VGTGILIAIAAGVLIGVQVAALGRYSRTASSLTVSLLVQLGGLVAAVAWTSVRQSWSTVLAAAEGWWWLPVGAAGWLVLAALGSASSRAGVATALASAFAAQLIVGLAWDARMGLGGFNGRAAAGAILLIVGAYLISSR
jgi:uncharacterized membrane protein YdcZ (DUF606 family)